jgi:hypothetical protein
MIIRYLRKITGKPQNENNKKVFIYMLLCCTFVSTGCKQQQQAKPLFIITRQDALHVERNPRISTSDVMNIADDVLTSMHFTIEKADAGNGFIRTRPLPGAQFFEFWRSDNVGADNTFAANIHTIRRTVTLNINQQTELLHINCEVRAQRLSIPERQISSSARIYGIFSRSSRSLQRLQINPQQKRHMAWIDLGTDSKLESEIIKRIQKRITQQANHLSTSMESKT